MSAMLLALGAALAPAIPLPYVSGTLVSHARALWLLGVLTLAIVTIAPHTLWIALIGLWFLIRWPQEADPTRLVPSFVLWLGVAASWELLLRVPGWAWPWIAWAWLATAGWHSAITAARRWKLGGRQKGDMGSPVITALYLALVSPFCPWWGWPMLGLGLGLISSVSGALGVAVGLIWLYPASLPLVAGIVALGLILWAWSPMVGGQRLLEWTPRGDTIDAIVSRVRGWQLLIHHGRKHWLLGAGPNTTEPALLKWGSQYDLELCWGEGFNDPLQLWYEYGALGVAAMAAFCWPIVQKLNIADPWSAAWLVGGVLALGHWPLRHVSIGLVWLAIGARLAQ